MKTKITAALVGAILLGISVPSFSEGSTNLAEIDIPAGAIDYRSTPFDWKQKHWLLNSFSSSDQGELLRVLSPFYSDDTDKFPFANGGQADRLPDFFAEDGWLMLQHNMGFDTQGEAKQYKDYSYPYVVLYNRERGIARVVAYINHAPYTFNSVEISLAVSSPGFTNKSANLFSTLKPVGLKDVAHYPAQASTLSPLYVHDAGQFVYGDIPLSYDPCVSLSELEMNLKISPVQTATLKLGGRQMLSDVPVVRGGEYVDPNMLASYIKDGNGLDEDGLGVLTYKNYSSMVNQMDSDRFAKAVYKEEGDEQLDTLVNVFKYGFAFGAKGAEMAGVPFAPMLLGKASEGLNYFNFTPTKTLDGFTMPEAPSYVSIGELALKGSSEVLSSVRNMRFPLPGSLRATGQPLGIFNLLEVPSAEVVGLRNPFAKEYSYVAKDGYTLKGAMFWNKGGPRLSFSLQQLGSVLSPVAKKSGAKVLVSLEARTETTKVADGQVVDAEKPQRICDFFYCAESKGLDRQVISSTPIPFDQWEDNFGRYTVNLSLPQGKYGYVAYRNMKLFLKVWVVPEQLLEGYNGDISALEREALAASAHLFTYPIPLRKVSFTELGYTRAKDAAYVKGSNGGFEMLSASDRGANLRVEARRLNQYHVSDNGQQTNVVVAPSGDLLSGICHVN